MRILAEIICKDCGCVIAECENDHWHYAPCWELLCDDCCDWCFENHEPVGDCMYRGD